MARPKDFILRFWEKSVIRDGCWGWKGTINCGRPKLMVNGVSKLASRVSWEIHYGKIPTGICVCHSCDNPLCVNPRHLFLGTIKDNTQDMYRKGRNKNVKGEEHGRSILTEKQVRWILKQKSISKIEIAKKFGVARTTISRIVRRKNWRWVSV